MAGPPPVLAAQGLLPHGSRHTGKQAQRLPNQTEQISPSRPHGHKLASSLSQQQLRHSSGFSVTAPKETSPSQALSGEPLGPEL